MAHTSYVGSGPYCYANALAMMLGADAPSPAVIEFATSSPFGMQVIGDKLAFFDPYGWTPLEGIEGALKAMGWEATLFAGKDKSDALERLTQEVAKGPVFVGPVEMGYLRYQPGNNGPIGADHYVVVLGVSDGMVELHDPHGHPYATLPVSDFMLAWGANNLGYGKPYMMYTGFRKIEQVTEDDVIRRSIAPGLRWLSMDGDHDMPPASFGNGDAIEHLTTIVEKDLSRDLRGSLVYFAIRVGARRAADGATCLARVGYADAAQIMARQARLIGSLQYPLGKGATTTVVSILRALAPTYSELKDSLVQKL
ncbi:radc family [Trichoderma arundinaceum]|uniref:Radc family n=1 Tax=Trichoderma arundinaceum TaxID=490622 RepID=A0A395NX28_TRIAR|nr:radc family [Trichoderma arundinaceum]